MSDDESIHIPFHRKTRHVPTLRSPIGPSFEKEMASSDEDDGNLRSQENGHQSSHTRSVDHEHHNPQVRKQRKNHIPQGLQAEMIC